MKIEKAIEIETAYLEEGKPVDHYEHIEAEKLGVEALKWRQEVIRAGFNPSPELLPGETKE